MGFMDSLKKASGLGLNADEHYQRAYEKGVLLGPENYAKAVELFDVAARKAGESGDAQLQIRARANAAFYGFVTTGARDNLVTLRDALKQLPEIEEIGSRTAMLPSEPLIDEIEARLAEDATPSSGDPALISKRHSDAASAFRKLLGVSLVTYRYHSPDRHRETGDERYFLHMGMASRYEAMQHAMDDPETAAEKMAKALSSFRQCDDEGLAADAASWVSNLRTKRTCWLCHRDFQGLKLHFDVYPARVSGHAQATVTRLGHDESTIDRDAGTVVLCTLCSSGITNIADDVAERRVDALRDEVQARLSDHEETMSHMIDRIKQLERAAHSH
jgi:hypothetical protein